MKSERHGACRRRGHHSVLAGVETGHADVKGAVTNACATGDIVVIEVTWQGTQTGPLQGPRGTVPATGKQQTTRSSWIMNFDGGKIKESRNYFDMLSFLQQLGVLPQ
jgi:steroid delta-isomerase-like uncharacterized protein